MRALLAGKPAFTQVATFGLAVEITLRRYSAASLLIIDEAARVEDAVYKALRPMVAVGDGDSVVVEHSEREAGILL